MAIAQYLVAEDQTLFFAAHHIGLLQLEPLPNAALHHRQSTCMDNPYDPEYFFLYEIRIRQIIFDETSDVTIFGSIPEESDYEQSVEWDFLCSFGLLTDLLMYADEKDEGDMLIEMISDKLGSPFEIPTVIDVENLFGRELIFSNLIYETYKPHEKNKYGIWEPTNDNCYIINSIEQKSEFFKREGENFKFNEHSQCQPYDLLEEALKQAGKEKTHQEQLAEYPIVLDNAFKYYEQLLLKEFTEKEARKRSGLGDELLFRIATLNNKILNK